MEDVLVRLSAGYVNEAEGYLRFLAALLNNPDPDSIPSQEVYRCFSILAGGARALELSQIAMIAQHAVHMVRTSHDSGNGLTQIEVEQLKRSLLTITATLQKMSDSHFPIP